MEERAHEMEKYIREDASHARRSQKWAEMDMAKWPALNEKSKI